MSQPPSMILEATGPEAETLREHRKAFGPEGGTIGRGPQCHWVLADDYVSRLHARVTYRNGQFFIEDAGGKSGVYLNDQRLPSEQPHPVRPGDRLLIEPYDILVAQPVAVADATAAMPILNPPTPIGSPANPLGSADLVPDLPLESVVDPLEALFPKASSVPPPRSESRPVPPASLGGGGVLKEVPAVAVPPPVPVSPSAREAPIGGIPEDWDKRPVAKAQADPRPLPSRPPAPPVSPPPAPRARTHQVPDVPHPVGDRGPRGGDLAPNQKQQPAEVALGLSAADVSELLTGAGLDGRTITPQMARQLGQILRVVVAGVLDVLHSRQQTKDAFRIRGTVIRAKGNNPLKHSADVNDALYNLFVKGGAGYLGPVEAFEDAFADVKNHQLAMLEGIRAAFRAMLERFDPERLQDGFDRTNRSRKKGALDKLKGSPDYWDMYRAWVNGLTEDADGSFRSLFGEVFSEAYEEQLQQLKASRKGKDDTP